MSDDYVEDYSPGWESSMTVRFYFTLEGDGSADIFQALSEEGSILPPEFFVRADAGAQMLSVSGTSERAPIERRWNFIEIHLGVGANRLWVNADPFTASPTLTFDSDFLVDSVRLGAINPVGDITVIADDYASYQTTPIGHELLGDANGDRTLDSADMDAIADEILGNVLNGGTPDCNLDTRVDIRDAVCVRNLVAAKSGISRWSGFENGIVFDYLFANGFESGGGGTGDLRLPPEILLGDADENSPLVATEHRRALNGETLNLPLLFDAAAANAFQFFLPYDPAELTPDLTNCGAMTMDLTVRCAADNGIIAVAGIGTDAIGISDIGTIALTISSIADGPIPLDIASPLFAASDQSLLPAVVMDEGLLISSFFDGFEPP